VSEVAVADIDSRNLELDVGGRYPDSRVRTPTGSLRFAGPRRPTKVELVREVGRPIATPGAAAPLLGLRR
jgi:hypothetical protein